MVNIVYVVCHEYRDDFVRDAESGTCWDDFKEFGLKEYIIV